MEHPHVGHHLLGCSLDPLLAFAPKAGANLFHAFGSCFLSVGQLVFFLFLR